MLLIKLLLLGYLCFVAVNTVSYLVSQYERAREADPATEAAHISLGRGLGVVLMEAAASYFTWLTLPMKFLERGSQVRLAGHNQYPILCVHGYYGHAGNFWVLRSKLRAMGLDCFAAYSYRTTAGSIADMATELSRQVDRIKIETGCERIDILAHSLGSLVAMHYITHMDGAASVRKLVAIAAPFAGTRMAAFFPRHAMDLLHPKNPELAELQKAAAKVEGTQFVSIYSPDDALVVPGESGELKGYGVNHSLGGMGHNTLLFSERTAEVIRTELTAQA